LSRVLALMGLRMKRDAIAHRLAIHPTKDTSARARDSDLFSGTAVSDQFADCLDRRGMVPAPGECVGIQPRRIAGTESRKIHARWASWQHTTASAVDVPGNRLLSVSRQKQSALRSQYGKGIWGTDVLTRKRCASLVIAAPEVGRGWDPDGTPADRTQPPLRSMVAPHVSGVLSFPLRYP
jgi:hypothetical protein